MKIEWMRELAHVLANFIVFAVPCLVGLHPGDFHRGLVCLENEPQPGACARGRRNYRAARVLKTHQNAGKISVL